MEEEGGGGRASGAARALLTLAAALAQGSGAAAVVSAGLAGVLPLEPLALFSPGEVEASLGCAASSEDCDLSALRASAVYTSGAAREDAAMVWLWEVLAEGCGGDRLAFLRFVSERSRVPPGGLAEPLKVGYEANGAPGGLPKASTCFLTLTMPRYESKAQLREKLLLAIHNAKTMELA